MAHWRFCSVKNVVVLGCAILQLVVYAVLDDSVVQSVSMLFCLYLCLVLLLPFCFLVWICQTSMYGQNAHWPCCMLLLGESQWVCWCDRWTDGPLHYAFQCIRDGHNADKLSYRSKTVQTLCRSSAMSDAVKDMLELVARLWRTLQRYWEEEDTDIITQWPLLATTTMTMAAFCFLFSVLFGLFQGCFRWCWFIHLCW